MLKSIKYLNQATFIYSQGRLNLRFLMEKTREKILKVKFVVKKIIYLKHKQKKIFHFCVFL